MNSNETSQNRGTAPEEVKEIIKAIQNEVARHIVGQDILIERLLTGIIADGHVLLEGVPGLAKTRTLEVLSSSIECKMNRVQFTPDLLPSDLIGTEIYRPQTGDFSIRKGPLFTNIVLADEINRAPAKVQSALLQAMQERQISIGTETFPLPSPFFVLATQNPIEQEGTYPLPEAQLDRFLMKVKVSYPDFEEEVKIVRLTTDSQQQIIPKKVVNLSDISLLRKTAQQVFVDPKIEEYIVLLVHATRKGQDYKLENLIDWGASPRAAIALKTCVRALALIRGRAFVTPDDVKDLAPDVLRHRILTSFDAESRGIDSDEIIRVLLSNVSIP